MGFPHSSLQFPYKRQSPTTKQTKVYTNMEDVEAELYDLVDTFKDNKFSIGRNLYFYIPLFADPRLFGSEESMRLVKEYNYMKNYHLPIANSLEEADSYKLEMFDVIANELAAITQYLGEKNV
tara:strand:+ start:5640 stop:6008 length:369 start_codon:yes stop_codon:yes gene_type:complete